MNKQSTHTLGKLREVEETTKEKNGNLLYKS